MHKRTHIRSPKGNGPLMDNEIRATIDRAASHGITLTPTTASMAWNQTNGSMPCWASSACGQQCPGAGVYPMLATPHPLSYRRFVRSGGTM